MKNLFGFIIAAALSAGTASAATVIDTSILKNGNSWVYSISEREGSGSNLIDGFTGSLHFRIDSLVVVQDTVWFKVTQRKVGHYLVWPVGMSPEIDTTHTSTFFYHTGAYKPAVPFFAAGQSFNDTDGQVIYHGDTLRIKSFTSSGPGAACLTTTVVNIQGIGRVTDSYAVLSCGTSSSHKSYQLTELNGQAYRADSVQAVSIRAAVKRDLKATPQSSIRKNTVVFDAQGVLFDTKGRKAPAVTPSVK